MEIMNSSMSDMKTQHEMFVSGHNGSDVLDILLVAQVAPLSLFFLKNQILWNAEFQRFSTLMFILEFVILVGALLCSLMTNISKIFLFLFSIIQFIPQCIKFFNNRYRMEVTGDNKEEYYSDNLRSLASERPNYLSNYRAYINLATSICILGVDFKAFPRRFCKTETFGTSVMDAGVGSFVVSNGIISREARGFQSRIGWRQELKSTWPLLLLGFSRVAVVKALGYQEHVTEYGLHWNFFFTLAFVKIASYFLFRIFSPKRSLLMAITISLTYELLLNVGGLSEYLLGEGNRSDVLHANREGLWSSLGYLSLYLSSVALGSFLFETFKDMHRHVGSYRFWMKVYLKIVMVAVTMWVTLFLYRTFVGEVSRRMANLPYVVWMVAYNAQMVSSFLLVDIIISYLCDRYHQNVSNTNPKLLDAINRHGLLFFLLSNLATGLVNVSMNTIQADFETSILVMLAYMLVLCGFFTVLDHFKLKLKFW